MVTYPLTNQARGKYQILRHKGDTPTTDVKRGVGWDQPKRRAERIPWDHPSARAIYSHLQHSLCPPERTGKNRNRSSMDASRGAEVTPTRTKG